MRVDLGLRRPRFAWAPDPRLWCGAPVGGLVNDGSTHLHPTRLLLGRESHPSGLNQQRVNERGWRHLALTAFWGFESSDWGCASHPLRPANFSRLGRPSESHSIAFILCGFRILPCRTTLSCSDTLACRRVFLSRSTFRIPQWSHIIGGSNEVFAKDGGKGISRIRLIASVSILSQCVGRTVS